MLSEWSVWIVWNGEKYDLPHNWQSNSKHGSIKRSFTSIASHHWVVQECFVAVICKHLHAIVSVQLKKEIKWQLYHGKEVVYQFLFIISQSISQSNKQTKNRSVLPKRKSKNTLGHTLGKAALFFCSMQDILHVLFIYVSCFAGISCWLFLQRFLLKSTFQEHHNITDPWRIKGVSYEGKGSFKKIMLSRINFFSDVVCMMKSQEIVLNQHRSEATCANTAPRWLCARLQRSGGGAL